MDRKLTVRLSDLGRKSWEFDSLRKLRTFCEHEAKFWEKANESISAKSSQLHPAAQTAGRFSKAVKNINSWEPNLASWSEEQFSQQVNSLDANILNPVNNVWLWSGHPCTSAFVEAHERYGMGAATAFLDYTFRTQITNIVDTSAFTGALLAYEFRHQDSDLLQRRDAEEKSIALLRQRLDETTSTLIGEVEEFKSGFVEWNSTIKDEWDEVIEKSSTEHDEQQKKQRDEYGNFINDSKTRIAELENTYEEMLRLDGPARYWKRAARRYGLQGGLWTLALIAAIVVGLVYFYYFFGAWLMGQDMGIKLQTLQGVVIFVSGVTVYAFLVKTLSRLVFSSFHLMRDAEEREQLTHLYLALNKDKQVDEASRNIVLQALFSRSETGLLSSESGPTMPGIGELMRAVPKS